MDLNERNFKALQDGLNTLYRDFQSMAERLQKAESNITLLRAELQNQKQLTAHVLGRGMGATVRSD